MFGHHDLHHEGGDQNARAEQKPANQSRIQPVEPIALIERGIQHREAGGGKEHAPAVGVAQRFAVDRLAWHAEADGDQHRQRKKRALAEDPVP